MIQTSASVKSRSGKERVVNGMTVIEGDLIMRKDRVFSGPLMVKGEIIGYAPEKRYNLSANGSISAERGIYVRKIWARGSIGTKEDIIALESVSAFGDVFAEGKIDTPFMVADNIYARDINHDGAGFWKNLRAVSWGAGPHEMTVNGLQLRM